MTGREILKELFKIIHHNYALNITDFSTEIDLWSNDETINALRMHPIIIGLPRINKLLDSFKEAKIGIDYLDNDFTILPSIEKIDFSLPGFIKRNRAFTYSDTDFGYLSLKYLTEIENSSSIEEFPSAYRTLIDYISTATVNGSTPIIVDLLTLIQNSDAIYGLLVRKIAHHQSPLSLYSYLYYKDLLTGDKIALDNRLNYNLLHGATASLLPNTRYEQYFEVYDILNELNHASDTITRFLKLYHIIEYLVYRRELVELEFKARTNGTFIREIHSFTGKANSDKEFEILKRNFKKIFEADVLAGSFDISPLTLAERDFIEKYWGIASFNHLEPNHLANIIYRIRNSIVHNKESEFHITTSNPDEYNDILNLIKRLMQILERQILNKLSLDAPQISYQSQHIELY